MTYDSSSILHVTAGHATAMHAAYHQPHHQHGAALHRIALETPPGKAPKWILYLVPTGRISAARADDIGHSYYAALVAGLSLPAHTDVQPSARTQEAR